MAGGGGKYGELRAALQGVAAVDAHAHPLADVATSFPFIRCFSEAEGDALPFAAHSLSFKRSIRDLAALYGCEASLQKLEEYRRTEGLLSVGARCSRAANISTVLLDDGILFDKVHDVEWHKCLFPTVARILRIEQLAESILNEEMASEQRWTLDSFMERFLANLRSAAGKIVGLKSIAAYRSGLEINPNVAKTEAEDGLQLELNGKKPIRITNKNLIDYLFTSSLEVAASFDLPMQIHTGFGDKDLDLRKCNPLHLRDVLEDGRFSKSKIVLLHASYPFSKEASYLASVYHQVYLDFGLAIPKLSVHGMISSVKELLELAPLKKVMFSTDGYAFPETFYLGAKRAREIAFEVLSAACEDGDLTISEAINAAEDIFRQNAMQLYKLTSLSGSAELEKLSSDYSSKPSIVQEDLHFVRIVWIDASGQHRCRVVPTKRFYGIVKEGVGLTHASMAFPSFGDSPANGTNLTGVGEIRLIPDMSTICRLPWSRHEEIVHAYMQTRPGEYWEYCPRSALRKVAEILKSEFNLEVKAGFENEFYVLKKEMREGHEQWVPIDNSLYCSLSAFNAASSMLQEVYTSLNSMHIEVEQLHAEAGRGQFEIALKYARCTESADKLIYARATIKSIFQKHGLLATFLPKPFPNDIGSGSHVHLSLWENDTNVFMGSEEHHHYGMSKIGENFLAGVYRHLPSILSFTTPHPNSYDRLQPGTWSGAYHCWGKENREAPIRTACPPGVPLDYVSNFEIKSFDGCANPHLGLAAIIAAGIDGLRKGLTLPEPTDSNPSDHASVLKRLPKDLSESVELLTQDKIFPELIGQELVTAIIAIRKAEVEYYKMNPEAVRDLIHRY